MASKQGGVSKRATAVTAAKLRVYGQFSKCFRQKLLHAVFSANGKRKRMRLLRKGKKRQDGTKKAKKRGNVRKIPVK